MGGALLSSLAVTHVAPEVSRKSAEIVTPPKLDLATARQRVRDMAPGLLEAAFPAPSRHQVCQRAHQTLGPSPDTFLRLIEGGTGNPDLLALLYACGVYRDKTGRVHPVTQFVLQITGAA